MAVHIRKFFKNGVLESETKIPVVTPEERERLEKEYDRTHPPGIERVSGCCDSPANYPPQNPP